MKVYISYSHNNKELASIIVSILIQNEFEVLGDFDLLMGEDYKNNLNNKLFSADAIVCLITPEYNVSKHANNELIAACAYSAVKDKPRIFPIVFEGAVVPSDIEGLIYLVADETNFNETVVRLIANLTVFRNDEEIARKVLKEEREVFQVSLSQFVKNAMMRLQNNENKNRRLAYCCYVGTGVFVLAAILLSLYKVNIDLVTDVWQMVVSKVVGRTLTIALVLILSRLLYVLGNSFMVEAVRNSDRIHAISFGEFFLNAYGNDATRDEVREVFGNWNIDNGSSFITQSGADFTPQNLEKLLSVYTALKSIATEKK